MHRRHLHRARAACALLLALLAIAGCRSDDPTSPPGGGITTVPKKGSIFVFDVYMVDTNDMEKPDSHVIDTVSFIQSGLSTGGRHDVLAVRYLRTGKLQYLHYGVDGDISYAYDQSDGTWPAWTWHTFPIVTKGKIGAPTVEDNQGGRMVFTDTLISMGSEDLPVAGQMVRCMKVREEVIAISYDGSTETSRTVYQEDYWFAPALGFFVYYSDDARELDSRTGEVVWKREDYRMNLKSYQLK